MNVILILFAGLALFALASRYYGAWVAKRVGVEEDHPDPGPNHQRRPRLCAHPHFGGLCPPLFQYCRRRPHRRPHPGDNVRLCAGGAVGDPRRHLHRRRPRLYRPLRQYARRGPFHGRNRPQIHGPNRFRPLFGLYHHHDRLNHRGLPQIDRYRPYLALSPRQIGARQRPDPVKNPGQRRRRYGPHRRHRLDLGHLRHCPGAAFGLPALPPRHRHRSGL